MTDLKALMLTAPRLTLAVAESVTAGNIQARVAAISGASKFFLGGVTAYTIDQKVKLLRVDRAAAEKVNCVSAEIAEQMARGVCELFGSDLGVATTGYAEPSPSEGVLTPFGWWTVAVRKTTKRFDCRRGRVECPGASRIGAQMIIAETAYTELVAMVEELRATQR